jgi:hypothetical protein
MVSAAAQRGSLAMTQSSNTFRSSATVFAAALMLAACGAIAPLHASHDIVIVKGEAGDAGYLAEIDTAAQLWSSTAEKAGHKVQIIGPGDAETRQLERLRAHLSSVESPSEEPLWLVLVGHGNAQGKEPKFVLSGPDLAAQDLSLMLSRIKRPAIIVAGFACSGAFIKPVAGPDRVLVSATRSGREDNWVRFSRLFAEAISSLDADLDADGEVSVFEAWLHSGRAVASFYKQEGRMLTEHSVLCDPEAAKLLEFGMFETKPKEPPKVIVQTEEAPIASRWNLAANPLEAKLSRESRAGRQLLETEITALRKKKGGMELADYQAQLEELLLRLAALYRPDSERHP